MTLKAILKSKTLRSLLVILFLMSAYLFGLFLNSSSERASILNNIETGMSIGNVRDMLQQQGKSVSIGGEEYHLFKLFKNLSAQVFGFRTSYIIIIKNENVSEWKEYQDYFVTQEGLWTLKGD